jgi:hypothetical protein
MHRILLFFGAAAILLGASAARAFPPIDLTAGGATYTSADGTIWTQLTSQPTGTGTYDPFLRLQANGTEAGMNTDGDASASYDDKAGVWTHSVLMGDLTVVNQGGQDYYSFGLDINEPNENGNLLSLDELRIYTVSNTGGGALLTESAVTGAGGTLRYNLDATVDQDVYMDYTLAAGSGHDDIQLLIPTSFFAGASSSDYMYFYNLMGATTGMGADFTSEAGFEEWHALTGGGGGTTLPEPSTVMLLGTGLLGLLAIRRKRL